MINKNEIMRINHNEVAIFLKNIKIKYSWCNLLYHLLIVFVSAIIYHYKITHD